ncbi:hypothetical protein K490DRAFT_62433 [Saccharata proteae CBS 121410]|uniref:AB hydrolase-1 domain-containing protein n=1 Tax=Saccharata proteae CBS 121410 TaxID=1314787 RepID=A0A9P4I2R9_9PEZI|nr:hypothetical protein K490DRAFT_62433 [Saccharata proteae CBS 121410]
MASIKPTIILVPGGWHTPDYHQPTAKLLQEYGHDVVCVELPSVGADPPLKSWDQDVVAIRHAVTSVVDAGRDVVLVSHSYGGLPAQEACRGMAKRDLQSHGKTGGVIRLVYVLQDNVRCMERHSVHVPAL